MKRTVLWTIALALCGFSGFEIASYAKTDDERQIRQLMDHFAAAFRAKDVDTLMSLYEHSDKLVIFDVVPPLQYTGWDAYRKDFKGMFDRYNGRLTFDFNNLNITTDGNMAYSDSIDHVTGTLQAGKKMDYNVRVTAVYRKIDGKWLIVHEHVSVPVNLATGKSDLQSNP